MTTLTPSSSVHSRYIVYVDESGDHGPVSAEYAMFVLAFCLFDKQAYANTVASYMHRLKFKHFGHDTLVLHEREIRKALPPEAAQSFATKQNAPVFTEAQRRPSIPCPSLHSAHRPRGRQPGAPLRLSSWCDA